jgi:L-seryl-tRNA(Ser) seleniumtransferase
MAQSGARLVEVGTTNRTHVRDYANAITDNTAAILVAHHSNFKIIGFTTEPSLAELAELARAHNLLLLYDQGSGALLDTSPYGLEREPLVGESVTAGCDVVAFSGDKLLGGPQAGILCGREAPIAQLKRHPLARAVRPDKLCYAALSATLSSYVRGSALDEIPVWRMMSVDSAELHATATRWANALQTHHIDATVIDGFSTVGGGTLPGQQLPTTLVALTVPDAESVAYRLRTAETAVICRIQRDQLLFDPRTVLPHQTNTLLKTIVEIVKPHE